ncbi:Hypothetical protein I596_540 [Dokdonella koreensis DS-123]|uniref:Uncharacterized protein n=1 Tax=Dokdonella koreensis DS-123 TaxID=1300342 RepID=A0A167GHY6_9GAMM|nr:Hypothetical protein I596_540 [Dokdonella koreensis DS-123]
MPWTAPSSAAIAVLPECAGSSGYPASTGRGCGGPCRARTYDQGIMRTTSAFAARFRFVVWTLSCLSAFPSSLYTFSQRELRSALAWRHCRVSVHRI